MNGRLDLEAIRQGNPLPGVIGATVELARRGAEYAGCCPFHTDRSPSFTVFDGGRRWHCFAGCGGGDVLDYLQRLHGVSLREAAAMLEADNPPVVAVAPPPPPDDKPEKVERARSIWRTAAKPQGTPVEAYLRQRGLTLPIPGSIRFARLPYGRDRASHPCLVALVASAEHRLTGIQRTYLTDAGCKAFGRDSKRSLGTVAGGAIRCAPAGVDGLLVTEGLEDALTLQQETGRAAWAAAGAAMLPAMRFPIGMRSVTIGADGDEPGERSARRAADAFTQAGLGVRIIRPEPPHKDFNAELMEGRA